ncbi:transporter substrate-binding domain-containing protein [Nocardia asiatica]|uniref:transporter substrate-binding domain-containing protein n=1 Tax=Nocardia asiatica TaxID=209252 RepID=UPI00245393E9|nr:transporter substrate-binding domain-containing protein [Nocardia asiatica]
MTSPGRIVAVLVAACAVLVAAAIPAAAQPEEVPTALRACTPGDYPPYSIRDDAGGHRGVDVDLAQGFAALLGRPIEFVPVTWATLKTDFAERNCDLAVGGISDLPSRRAFADFSITYGTDGKAPVTHRADGAAYSTIAEINRPDVRVIANRGGTNEEFARKNFPAAQLTLWPDNLTIFGELEQGRADVFVTDSVEGRYRVRQHPDLQVLHPESPFDSFGKVLLVRKGDPVLAAMVDAYLATQLATGAVDRLFDQWIGPNASAR